MKERPEYETPRIVTYQEDEILEELGPAQPLPCSLRSGIRSREEP